ncbi:MAG: exopolysaccharide biosynthesis polyprenyl glycosylphosphotransferase [Vampirovibrio sp.]|jgi:exopolysaccharide biosynthesis polyprenyl glycosylphosphotransferase|nr:exopolysaccharide biosynthesis polyprenyl glycosylphosphotransferase [Vampirovibrio sp.]
MSILELPVRPPHQLKKAENSSIDLVQNAPEDPYLISRNLDISQAHPFQWLLKRGIDYSLGLFALMIFAPMMLLIAIFIVLDARGPILFKQKRVGLNGKEFNMFKFRSMYPDAEKRLKELLAKNESSDGMFKMKNDPRITRVGHYLRKYSLDELPQIFNVLRGEMSLVGPRPPLVRELEFYKPWHYVRFASLPGMTGMWQVSGRSEIKEFDDVVKLDYQYIDKWNILLDIRLIFKTIPAVLFADGAV